MSFKIDGVEVRSPDLSYKYDENYISYRINDIFANSFGVSVAEKAKFYWKYEAITLQELRKIEQIIKAKTTSFNANPNFRITTWTVVDGFIDVFCYLAGERSIIPKAVANGVPVLFEAEYRWIQVYADRYKEVDDQEEEEVIE